MPGVLPGNTVPVVDWQALAHYAPDSFGGFTAQGATQGSTTGPDGGQVSEVHREYTADGRQLHLSIADTTVNPSLRLAFNIGRGVTMGSPQRQEHGGVIAGNPGLFVWRLDDGPSSKVTLLVADRYLVSVEVKPAHARDEASGIIAQLDLAGLATVH